MDDAQRHRRKDRFKVSFIIMAVFLVEIIGLIQAVFSAESIKFELEHKMEKDVVQLLREFRSAYDMTEDIQSYLYQFSQKQIDESLIRTFKQTENALIAVRQNEVVKTYTVDSLRVSVRKNIDTIHRMLGQRYGLQLNELRPFKIMTYETKQDGVVIKRSRMLLGLTSDKRYFIEMEFDEEASNQELQKAQRALNDILSKAYYFNEKSGNFYIFSESGKVVYQGGFEKNAEYFNQLDLNSNTKIFDLIQANPQMSIRVIYDAGGTTKRSMIYSEQDFNTGAYYVYEVDLKKRFAYIDTIYKGIWVMGVSVLLMTFGVVWFMWSKTRIIKD